jgi:hypothetical protein
MRCYCVTFDTREPSSMNCWNKVLSCSVNNMDVITEDRFVLSTVS